MNVFDLPVHPHANIFQMLSEAELAELANSLHRTEALVDIAKEPGGLARGLKRRGVAGW